MTGIEWFYVCVAIAAIYCLAKITDNLDRIAKILAIANDLESLKQKPDKWS